MENLLKLLSYIFYYIYRLYEFLLRINYIILNVMCIPQLTHAHIKM